MCQGSQVARCSQRTLLIDNRKDIIVEHVDKPLDGNHLDARMTV